MTMLSQINTQSPAAVILLGDTRLIAESYRLKAECPVLHQTLCDGTQYSTVLGMRPCTLTFSGRKLNEEGAELIGTLHSALRLHTPFSFSFAGCSFSDMRMTNLVCEVSQLSHVTAYTVTLIGSVKEDDAE